MVTLNPVHSPLPVNVAATSSLESFFSSGFNIFAAGCCGFVFGPVFPGFGVLVDGNAGRDT
jgi:hypothetical protein